MEECGRRLPEAGGKTAAGRGPKRPAGSRGKAAAGRGAKAACREPDAGFAPFSPIIPLAQEAGRGLRPGGGADAGALASRMDGWAEALVSQVNGRVGALANVSGKQCLLFGCVPLFLPM